jgi:hypothetical protein
MSDARHAGQNRFVSKALPHADDYVAAGRIIENLPITSKENYNIPEGVSESQELSELYDLEREEILKKVIRNADRLSEADLRDVWDIISRKLDCDVSAAPLASREKVAPLWSKRTTGREVSPVDWIKMHYGRMVDGVWDADGLAQADISRLDRKLYDAYISRVRRLPEEDLGLPAEPRKKIIDPGIALERKREGDRAYARQRSEKRQLKI